MKLKKVLFRNVLALVAATLMFFMCSFASVAKELSHEKHFKESGIIFDVLSAEAITVYTVDGQRHTEIVESILYDETKSVCDYTLLDAYVLWLRNFRRRYLCQIRI